MQTELYDFEEKPISLRKNKNFCDYSEAKDEYGFFDYGIDEGNAFFNDIGF